MLSTPVRPRHIPLALLLLPVAVALAQDSVLFAPGNQRQVPNNRSAPRRTLAGTVVNSITGEPLRRALVRVNGPEAHVAFTGPDGRFEIANVVEGQLFVTAEKPGFFDPSTSPQQEMPFRSPMIAFGPGTGEVVLKLLPEAKIRGHVLDKTREPIESVQVQLLARTMVSGRKQWQTRGQTNTDDSGSYVFDNLTPGLYAVHTLALPTTPPAGSEAANEARRSEVFPAAYYPDAPDLSSLQPFALSPGQELPVELALSPVPAFRVSGVVAGAAQGQLGIICEDAEGQAVSRRARVDFRTGRFTISAVPPGSWTLHAFSQLGQDGVLEAEQPIEVVSSDLAGLALQLQPLSSIPVHVQNKSENQNVNVGLTSATANQRRQRLDAYTGPGDAPGSVALHDIPAGNYKIFANLFGASACIGSVQSGSTDLARSEFTVVAGSQPPPIEITLRTDCGTISGTVHSSSEQPPGIFVVLLGDSSVTAPQPVQAGGDGKFSVANLTPGEYQLFAFDNISDLEFANPEALRDFTGQQVNVAPNDTASVELDLSRRAK